MKFETILIWVLGATSLTAAACTMENKEHCWLAAGDQTCKELLGGGFCSDDRPACEGYGVAYGCVFERPKDDACYSPEGNGTSCEGPNPPATCTELADESGESGMTETDGTETPEAVCGNGIPEGDEECDDGNADNTDDCTDECKVAVCGDMFVQDGIEECDDGNADNTDLCTNHCIAAVCGDLIVQIGEECDDGNLNNTDACTNVCALAVCGDMIVHDGVEDCDDGNMNNADECTNYCTEAVCGDMLVEGAEECDDGDQDNEDYCTNDCKIATCGDGILQPGEACDDGNQDMNDSCAGCQINGKVVFVTSMKYTGDLNGIAGADAICNAHATAANLPGYYMAWISTNNDGENPAARFVRSMKPYYLVSFVKIADNWNDLTDGSLDAPIDRTELGALSPSTDVECMGTSRIVRTGTAHNGTAPQEMDPKNNMGRCNNFTSTGAKGSVGRASSTDSLWAACDFQPGLSCNIPMPIYCFQQ